MKKDEYCFEIMYLCLSNIIFFPYSVFSVTIPPLSSQCLREMKERPQIAICFLENNKVINTSLLANITNIEIFADRIRLHLEGARRIYNMEEVKNDTAASSHCQDLLRARFSLLMDDYSDYNQESVIDLFVGIRDAIGGTKETGNAQELFLVHDIVLELFGPFAINPIPLIESPEFFSCWLDLCFGQIKGPYKYKQMAFRELNLITRFEIFVEKILPADLEYRKEITLPQESKSGSRNNKTVDFSERIKTSKMSEEAKQAAEYELERLQHINPESAEYNVARTYLDWLVNLPWSIFTEDNFDIKHARQILDEDHAYLNRIKDRIEEYLAVRKLNPDCRGQILCFVGPPGTGKTSVGRSIARALGRKFIRMSLGDIKDEAHIRGHRRTYVGALPGRIIQEIRKAGTQNPVFMFDEVDKIGQDYKGDPASALLEVLDPEQNFSFSDHYLGVSFDLSRVMFIATANTLDTIPSSLQDRMEIIEFSTYLDFEKLEIAKQHLISKMIKEHGLGAYSIKFSDEALLNIIRFYTKEAGVRELERKIGALCRKVAKKISKNEFNLERNDNNIDCQKITDYLGAPEFSDTELLNELESGIVVGLVWTSYGGDILHIEALETYNLSEKFKVTGFTEKVMRDSIEDVISFLNSHRKELGISDECFAMKNGIHIRPRGGNIRKDGPSAGLAIGMACYSMYMKTPIRTNVAFTGELMLCGKVDPVGGIREKFLGAKRAGIKRIFLSVKNRNNVEELDNYIKEGMEIVYVSNIKEIIIGGDSYNIFLKTPKNGDK